MRKSKEESRFVYKGFTCYVLFLDGGYRCGYVELPENHKLVGVNYDAIDIQCHGGLTFGEYVNHIYTLGFDCAHCVDGHDFKQSYDYKLVTKREMQELINSYAYQGEYAAKSREFVENELRRIVDQLIEYYS